MIDMECSKLGFGIRKKGDYSSFRHFLGIPASTHYIYTSNASHRYQDEYIIDQSTTHAIYVGLACREQCLACLCEGLNASVSVNKFISLRGL